jgi:hypothetical protein
MKGQVHNYGPEAKDEILGNVFLDEMFSDLI